MFAARSVSAGRQMLTSLSVSARQTLAGASFGCARIPATQKFTSENFMTEATKLRQTINITIQSRGIHRSTALCEKSAPAAEAAAPQANAVAATGFMAAVLAFPKAQPFATNIIIATIKTSIADLMTQVVVEGKEEIDWKRNGVFVMFGMVYLGGFQYWLQVTQFRKMFPTMDRFANQSMAMKMKDTAGMIDTVKQVLFDVFIHLPMMYFPTFYAVKEFVQGDSWSPVDWVVNGCTKYYNNFEKDFTAMFCVWFPADVIIFAVPIWLRLPTRHAVSLAWTSYLSFLRGGATPKVEELARSF